jgi:Protein of unknown function (DUF3465)
VTKASTRRGHRCLPYVIALVAVFGIAACSDPKPDNPGFVHDLTTAHAAEVTVSGRVTGILPDSNGPAGPHEDFDIDVSGHTVEIDHNLTLAPRVPVKVGDIVAIHGQFEPDPGHPVIHYTHHATDSHPGGWIKLNGHKYW